MSDPFPSPEPSTPAPVPTPPVPGPGVPPAPSEVRAGGFDAPPVSGFSTMEAPYGGRPAGGSFSVAGESRGRGRGAKILLAALVIAALVGIGAVTGVIKFSFWVQRDQPPQAPPAALGEAAGGHFQGSGITFRYPAGWQAVSGVRFSNSAGGQSPSAEMVFAPGSQDEGFTNAVIVETYALLQPVTDANKSTFRDSVSNLVDEFTRQGGSVESPVADGSLGNLPAFLATVRLPASNGPPLQVRMFVGYQGSTEYFVACQSTPGGRIPVTVGCRQVLRTFHVAEASA
jgi:hypothetical protein